MAISTRYLADDFSQVELPDDVIRCPEALLNGLQIQVWVAMLREEPKSFATTSIYLLRELELQKIPCQYINFCGCATCVSDDCDALGDLEILQRELEQSERYLRAS